jgi:hypothetical protein
MSDGAAKNLPVQHAGHCQMVHILGTAGDLVARFQPRHGTANLFAACLIDLFRSGIH